MSEMVMGVDGGGTRTRAVLATADGTVIARSNAGSGNFQSIGLDGVEALFGELVNGLEVASRSAGQSRLSVCLALAGAGRKEEQVRIANRLSGNHIQVFVVSDARAALEGAHGGRPGVVVIAGTGSMVLGKNAAGDEARAGGWGAVLGDEGSGYAMALAGLRAVLRFRDGWGPATALEVELAEAFQFEQWDDVVAAVYGGRLDRSSIAAAAPRVMKAARGGDQVSIDIVEAGATALGRQVGAVVQQLGMTGVVDVAGAGGLFEQGDMLWATLQEAALGRVAPRSPLLPPVMGALILARKAVRDGAGETCSDDWIEGLVKAEASSGDQS